MVANKGGSNCDRCRTNNGVIGQIRSNRASPHLPFAIVISSPGDVLFHTFEMFHIKILTSAKALKLLEMFYDGTSCEDTARSAGLENNETCIIQNCLALKHIYRHSLLLFVPQRYDAGDMVLFDHRSHQQIRKIVLKWLEAK